MKNFLKRNKVQCWLFGIGICFCILLWAFILDGDGTSGLLITAIACTCVLALSFVFLVLADVKRKNKGFVPRVLPDEPKSISLPVRLDTSKNSIQPKKLPKMNKKAVFSERLNLFVHTNIGQFIISSKQFNYKQSIFLRNGAYQETYNEDLILRTAVYEKNFQRAFRYKHSTLIDTQAYKYLLDVFNKIELADEISKHKELTAMDKNIASSTPDKEYRHKKLFSMYKEHYTSALSRQITDLSEFSKIMTTYENAKVFMSKSEFNKQLFSDKPYDHLCGSYSFDEIVNFLSDAKLRKRVQLNIYADSINRTLYIALAGLICKSYNLGDLIRLIYNFEFTVKHLDELQRKYESEQERQRLLRGDMSYENELENFKLNLANVRTGNEFEKFLAMIFRRLGYDVKETKGSGDKGADLILERNKKKYIIQAKFYSKPIGNKAIQEAHSAKDIYKTHKAAVITNNTFTRQATEDGNTLNVVLVNGDLLQAVINVVAQRKFVDIFNLRQVVDMEKHDDIEEDKGEILCEVCGMPLEENDDMCVACGWLNEK